MGYNPETGRFINADGMVDTGQGLVGTNMFAYCENNPVMFLDPAGTAMRPWSGDTVISYWSRQGFAYQYTNATGDYFKNRAGEWKIIPKPQPTPLPKKTNGGSGGGSSKIQNHIIKSHETTPKMMIDLGPVLGKIGISSTTTVNKENVKPGVFYSYDDYGLFDSDDNRWGAGINPANGWFMLGTSLSDNWSIYGEAQLTPWVHGDYSIGLDGIGFSYGIDINDKTTLDFEMKAGWLTILTGGIFAGGGLLAGIGQEAAPVLIPRFQ